MRVAMIGTGYVGLVSGACIADFGHEVTCVDKDAAEKIAAQSGEMPIFEPGLSDLVQTNVARDGCEFAVDSWRPFARLTLYSSRSARRRGAAMVMPICLTSMTRLGRLRCCRTRLPLLSPSRRFRSAPATRSNASFASYGLTSTSPVVSNPEFLREGAAIHDFKHPDRIVVGTR